jgi:hypothetical protein
MIDNLIAGGICFLGGMFVGFLLAVLIISASAYTDDCEGCDDDR